MCLSVLLTCMCVCHVHVWCPTRSEGGIRSPSTEVTMVMNYTTDAGNWTLSSARTTGGPQPPSPSLEAPASSSEVKDAVTHKVKHGLCPATCASTENTDSCWLCSATGSSDVANCSLQQNSWGRFRRVGASTTQATEAQDLISLFFPGFPFSAGI